ncbi:hypothetical protein COV93_05015 [Candidatus Woesearchaeota archaeon CG11_big_fil_rev_8_21_14_0_20_43_8]|nr:MAG: hypothetical protein COV93_05015 [Candidatus Woesearchaeota archaeon CG11_big_fil_rev_8_21_14_0_20_43_8]PIO04630.1 MAG: hypothetical protein COT47_08200 [Candidatus Woesearchaeota archaeon CG08_land_8_20_14_0_20_43_7]
MKLLDRYARWISHHPYLALLMILIITAVAGVLASRVGTTSMDNEDTLPDGIDVIDAFDIISDNFGGTDSIMIAIEIDSKNPGSDEVRDIRDPRVIEYMYHLEELSSHVDDAISATSAASILKAANGGTLPKSKTRVIELTENIPAILSYLSQDHTMGIISIRLTDEYTDSILVQDLQAIIDDTPRPAGLLVNVAGDIAVGPIIESFIGEDMGKTSSFSMIGIIIVLFLLFFSVRYALTPLTVILIGIIWAFGYLGLIGTNLNPATSGVISMIMGVGIDFGIQTISRFRQEMIKHKLDPAQAMEITLKNVFWPMATTTLAALLGFKAMSMGDLTIMQELATIMSYGILFCFFAAITVVPVVSIIGESFDVKMRKTKRQLIKRFFVRTKTKNI